jgi:hypothetical protein
VLPAHLGLNSIIEAIDDDRAAGEWRLLMPATTRAGGRADRAVR